VQAAPEQLLAVVPATEFGKLLEDGLEVPEQGVAFDGSVDEQASARQVLPD